LHQWNDSFIGFIDQPAPSIETFRHSDFIWDTHWREKEPKISGAYYGQSCQINGMLCSIHWQVASLWLGSIRMLIY